MPWGENDDKEIEEYIKKLSTKITKLDDQLTLLRKLTENWKKIKTVKKVERKEKKSILLKSKPLDEFGEEMDNKERMARKKKLMSKTDEILKHNISK